MAEPLYVAFFSVDIANSTPYKLRLTESDGSEGESPWTKTFEQFYRDFPTELAKRYRDVPVATPPEALRLWKCAGDELLLFAPLGESPGAEALCHVLALKREAERYSQVLREQSRGAGLGLKLTGWLAQFPLPNVAVWIEVPSLHGASRMLDFIGPSIDLGFRVSQFATPRRMALTADLALLLLAAEQTRHGQYLWWHYVGRERCRGLLGCEDYPVCYVDLQDKAQTQEEELLGQVPLDRNGTELLRGFLLSFCEAHPLLHLPLATSDDSLIGIRPTEAALSAIGRMPPFSLVEPLGGTEDEDGAARYTVERTSDERAAEQDGYTELDLGDPVVEPDEPHGA